MSVDGEHSSAMGTQTDASGPGARELLEVEVATLRKFYESKRSAEQLVPSRTIEERMIAFSRDAEERMQNDLRLQLQHMRESVARVGWTSCGVDSHPKR